MHGPREQQNGLTAFIDGSQIYGTSDAQARELRGVFDEALGVRGVHARMKVQLSEQGHHLLPSQNALLLPQVECNTTTHDKKEKFCFRAGNLNNYSILLLRSI